MKSKFKIVSGLIACLGLAMQVNMSSAQVMTFDTRSSFDSAVGSTLSENFNSFNTEEAFHSVALDVGDFTLSVTGPASTDENIIDIPPAGAVSFEVDGTAAANVRTDEFVSLFVTFDAPISAWGADFSGLNNSRDATEIFAAGATLAPALTTGAQVRFFGFKSDIPFTTIEFRGTSEISDRYGIDNVAFATAVPEPNSLVILGVVAMIFAGGRRRRNLEDQHTREIAE